MSEERPLAPISQALDDALATDVDKDTRVQALIKLDAFAKDKTLHLPGDLRHYLSRRSYEKARALLASL